MATGSTAHLPNFRDAGKQIRLLRRVCAIDDPPTFQLAVWDLDSLPDFQAISYTWGSPKGPRTININGAPFPIRRNCYYALWQAGLHYPDCYIWTDSICIDQNSLEEKNQQVPLMSTIYSEAKGVLTCIGPHANGSEKLYGCGKAKEPTEGGISARKWMWKPLKSLWQRPYWSRLWIVQELVLAKQVTILCGEHELSYKDLSLLPWRQDWTDHISGAPGLLLDVIRGIKRRESLWTTVATYTQQQCQDPRDHVYGVLALAKVDLGGENVPFRVDYSISLPSLVLQVVARTKAIDGVDVKTFQMLMSFFGLNKGEGRSALLGFRNALMQDASARAEFEKLFSEFKPYGDYDIQNQRFSEPAWPPGLQQHLCYGCEKAAFDVGCDGRLTVRPLNIYDMLEPRDRPIRSKPKFNVSPDKVTPVDFSVAMHGNTYTITANVSTVARPGDLLVRTGRHVWGKPYDENEPTSVHNTTLTSQQFKLHPDSLGKDSPEQLVIVRYISYGIFKVVGQGYMTACRLRGPDDVPADDLCFGMEHRHLGRAFSLMTPEATFLMWTHGNALTGLSDDERHAMLSEIVSLEPLPSAFYFENCTLWGDIWETGRIIERTPNWYKDREDSRHVLSQVANSRA